MNWLKKLWDWVCGVAKTLLDKIVGQVIDRVRDIVENRELTALALEAVKAAAHEGLTDDKAWVYARDKLVSALKSAGRELGDCAVDTLLQVVYDAWKNRNP